MNKPKIGIRPTIDGRWGGVREGLEEQTMGMAKAAAELLSSKLTYPDGTPVECVISPTTIGGGLEAATCAAFFGTQNVCATLSVTPCWCYGSETMDIDPLTIKAVWGFNGTERPGAVYLAAVMAAHAQKGLPAFSIYGKDVQDLTDKTIPADVEEKILRFGRCAIAAGSMRNTAYVGLGSVSMGIAGSYIDDKMFQKYLGIRSEWIDLTEILRRIHQGDYCMEQYEKALAWIKANCVEGIDVNRPEKKHNAEQKAKEWEFVAKMTLAMKDVLSERNAIAGGFQGQRMWTDWLPNGDFPEAILNSSFDWNGKKQPTILATENDTLNGLSMLFGNLLTGTASVFADVRTYWSPEAVERVSGKKPTGKASNGFIHLINSGAAALDGTGLSDGKIKQWWDVTEQDIEKMTKATDWCPANLDYFRGGGFSSHWKTEVEMPITLIRMNMIDGVGPTIQVVEGYTVVLPDDMHATLYERTDKAWPTTWFAPRVGEKGAEDVYTVMANWGANHGSFTYGHIAKDVITLASMLRIPVALHNVPETELFRPHAWKAFGTKDLEAADYKACATYGAMYKQNNFSKAECG